MVPEICRGCGDKLGAMDRVYCGKPGCQEQARNALYAQLGSLPKERMLVMLADDACAYAKKGDPGGFELTKQLEAKVKAYPWDDCAAFLREREAIAQGRTVAEEHLSGRLLKSREPPKEATGDLFAGLNQNLDELKRVTDKQIEGTKKFGEAVEKFLDRGSEKRGVPNASPLDIGPSGWAGRARLRVPYSPPTRQAAVLGFGPQVVPPKTVQIFQALPQVPFRGKHLSVKRGVGSSFDIKSLRIGVSEQLSHGADGCPTPVPAVMFEEGVVGVACNLGLDAAYVGQIVSMTVENKTQMEQVFEAMIVGETELL